MEISCTSKNILHLHARTMSLKIKCRVSPIVVRNQKICQASNADQDPGSPTDPRPWAADAIAGRPQPRIPFHAPLTVEQTFLGLGPLCSSHKALHDVRVRATGFTMNLLLSDDYLLQDYPEHITNTIRSGHSTCVRFNRKGDYLASGRVDGTVVIWDLETMGVARKLRGHSKNISSLSWSRCGRYLLSACQAWKAILWDLQDGKRYREVRFRAPVYSAELHPWNQ